MLSHSCAHAAPVGSARFHPARSTCCCALRDPARSSVSVEKYSCSAVPPRCYPSSLPVSFISCALSTSITWERTPHPVRRPAFSLENKCGKEWVKQLRSALELLCARVVGAVSPSTALDRRSGCDRNNLRRDHRSCADSCASDSQ